uniref:Peptidase C1A papain C-terminal domain-containing protein n=1 Tax=Panagrolaimus sp. JU765 TaxID=591449 RepID=A0AC34REF7_9BILA
MKFQLLFLSFLVPGLAWNYRAKNLESDESTEDSDLVLSKSTFVLDDYRKMKIDPEAEALSGQALIDYVNRRQDLWTAKANKFSDMSDTVKYGLMGVNNVKNSIKAMKHQSPTRFLDMEIPTEFDSRKNWPECQSLRQIRDQSSCGSCWAFGAVEAMSDRICIASKGRLQVSLSADDLLSCCRSCGFGCNGGDPLAAWRYWVKDGIVTGSNYTEKQGCKPYPFPPCEHHSNRTHFQPCKHDLYPTPKCEKTCQDGYDKSYKADKFYGKTAYSVQNSVEAIQKELMTHGPMEVAFEVYEDFLNYQGGIYVHQGGKLGGGHAVKLVGWGEESGVPYWIVANSWNTDWGEDGFFRILRNVDECGIESGAVDWGEDGFFRILRNVDECGIESGAVGGIPRIDSFEQSRFDGY